MPAVQPERASGSQHDPEGLAIVREAARLVDLPLFEAGDGALGTKGPLEVLGWGTKHLYRLTKGWQ